MPPNGKLGYFAILNTYAKSKNKFYSITASIVQKIEYIKLGLMPFRMIQIHYAEGLNPELCTSLCVVERSLGVLHEKVNGNIFLLTLLIYITFTTFYKLI